MALDETDLKTPGTPAWWMATLARLLLDRNRVKRLATLDAYRSGCPPMTYLAPSERKGWYEFQRKSRTNFARKIVSAPCDRMTVRAIRTAAADDERGDTVAWRYWSGSALDVQSSTVHSDLLTFSEGFVRVGLDRVGRPLALRRDPRFTVAVPDPLDPRRILAAFELLWDEWAGMDYAYLWLPGQQWVAQRERMVRPGALSLPGISTGDARRFGWWWPRLSFDPGAFTMRPLLDVVDPQERSGPYCERFAEEFMPMVRWENQDGVGEFEEHLDILDRINHTVMQRLVITAVQAFKQRALEQADGGQDRLPSTNPETGKAINWDEVFQPGPDALWKLPPGVKIWESAEVQLAGILSAVTDDVKKLSSLTDTPFAMLSDDVNQSAEGAQFRREGLVFKVENRGKIAGRGWAEVTAKLLYLAPDEDRYPDGDTARDRADASQIVIDWAPAERFSLSERASADGSNKSLSVDMAAAKIWGLTPDEVSINRAQRNADQFAVAALAGPAASGG